MPTYDEIEADRLDPAHGHPVHELAPHVEDWLSYLIIHHPDRYAEAAALSLRMNLARGRAADENGQRAQVRTDGEIVLALEELVSVMEAILKIDDPSWSFEPRRWSTYSCEGDRAPFPATGWMPESHPAVAAVLDPLMRWIEAAGAHHPEQDETVNSWSYRLDEAVGWTANEEHNFAWIFTKADVLAVLKELVALMREAAPLLAHLEEAH